MENYTRIYTQIKKGEEEVTRVEMKLENMSWKHIDNKMIVYIKDFKVDKNIIDKNFKIGDTITFTILVISNKGEMYEAGRVTDIVTDEYHLKCIDIEWTVGDKDGR